MQNERPLLTIAIPTYNRRACLAELLEVLGPQLAEESRVELVISDNASPDDTAALVSSLSEKGLRVHYSRNDTNIGADANFIRCYELAQGEYVWIFGDDDIIVPGGLQEVLHRLEARDFDLIYLRAKAFRKLADVPSTARFSHRIKVFEHPQDFALHAYTGLSFISGNIIRKAALAGEPLTEFRKLIGTNLAQLSWTFTLLRKDPRCAVLFDDIVWGRMENSGGHGTCQVFGTNLCSLVEQFFGLESPIGRAILNRTVQSFFPWAMVENRRARNSQHLTEDSAAILRGLYGRNPRYWFFLEPVFRLPLPLAVGWQLTGKVLNRVDRLLGFPIAR